MKPNIDREQYKADQLRKDKIIYAVEAVATNSACLLGYGFAGTYLTGGMRSVVQIICVCVGIGYTLYMGIGNAFRLKKIHQLEESIY